MTYRSSLLTRLPSTVRSFHTAIAVSAAVLLLLLPHTAGASAANAKRQAAARCAFSDAEFDPGSDVHALDNYSDAITQLLKQDKFADLDCLADAARAGKTKFPGGTWNLHNLYLSLGKPRPAHATNEDWQHHLDLIERWQGKNPQSIAAPIALADAYVGYGWYARGNDSSDTVSDSGWKLFGERLAKAKSILEDASALATKDPEWYCVMLEVAQGQSWGRPRETELFEHAVAFEPDYQYYYRLHATILLPKWSGEDGDAARFAQESADRVGGESGDVLYFRIAET